MEKKSNKRAVGVFPSFFVNKKKVAIPPINPPVRLSPGKYGNNKKTNGFKKLELGCKITNKILEIIKENIPAKKAILKMLSKDTSFRSKTKSSLDIRYKENKNIKKQISNTKIKNCILKYVLIK